MHPSRRANIDLLHRLAGEGKWEDLYRRHALWEFGSETRMGFQLAFLRPFCDPAMAATLVAAGRIAASPEKRAYDTGLVIHEVIAGGTDAPRARRMIAHMNRQHRAADGITPEQMFYMISVFMVVPIRYVERAGWRPVLDVEKQAAHHFYDRLGELMNIVDRPGTFEEAGQLVDEYERAHLEPNGDTLILGEDLLGVLKHRLPRPLQPLAGQLLATQIGDDVVAHAVGLPRATAAAVAVSEAGIRARRAVIPHLPAERQPSFTPGQRAGAVYAHGYKLEDIERDKA